MGEGYLKGYSVHVPWGPYVEEGALESSDTADETKPMEETTEVKIESEAERTERLWDAVKEFASS